jgi:hypothetical protein
MGFSIVIALLCNAFGVMHIDISAKGEHILRYYCLFAIGSVVGKRKQKFHMLK